MKRISLLKREPSWFAGLFREVAAWSIFALLLSAVIWFVCSVLFAFDFAYRDVFWKVFAWPLPFILLLYATTASWRQRFITHLRSGRSWDSSFDKSCDEVRFRLPRFMLKPLARLVSKPD